MDEARRSMTENGGDEKREDGYECMNFLTGWHCSTPMYDILGHHAGKNIHAVMNEKKHALMNVL